MNDTIGTVVNLIMSVMCLGMCILLSQVARKSTGSGKTLAIMWSMVMLADAVLCIYLLP